MTGRSIASARQIAASARRASNTGATPPGIKSKDLMGIPWTVAFALRDDGWYLRADVIWAKPNPMPESVTDRPTKAHEYVFLLSKSPRYFYNGEAVAEPCAEGSAERMAAGFRDAYADGAVDARGYRGPLGGKTGMQVRETRNVRTVWSIASQPFKGAHFATMPVDLARRCVMAGSVEGDLVLDPFNGAGTTGLAALEVGRSYIGIELNPAYARLAEERLVGMDAQLPLAQS